MEIKVEKWIIDSKDIKNESYKITKAEKCCDKITEYKNIGMFIDDNYTSTDYDNVYCVGLIEHGIDYSYGEEFPYTNYDKVDYCPFCGAKINVAVKCEVDVTDKHNKLRAERDVLWGKYNSTDSIKEQRVLRTKVYDLDNQIDNIFSSDENIF